MGKMRENRFEPQSNVGLTLAFVRLCRPFVPFPVNALRRRGRGDADYARPFVISIPSATAYGGKMSTKWYRRAVWLVMVVLLLWPTVAR